MLNVCNLSCTIILLKKLQNYKGKNDIVRGLNDKQTTPDSSVYLWGDVITAGLRATRFVK